jgi:hypothetical protein
MTKASDRSRPLRLKLAESAGDAALVVAGLCERRSKGEAGSSQDDHAALHAGILPAPLF